MNKVVLQIEVDRPLVPGDIEVLLERAEAALPASTPGLVIALSGRLPVWAFLALGHYYHPALAVASFDPRLGGAVVTASHSPEFEVGQVVALYDYEYVEVELE